MKQLHDLEAKKLLKMATEASARAYSPHTGNIVGACLKASSGAYYLAGTVESKSDGSSLCAERIAFCKAVYEGERDFEALAITKSDAPVTCGVCLEMLSELCSDDMPVVCGNSGSYTVTTFGELLSKVQ